MANSIRRTCLCGCRFVYTWATDPSVDEQIETIDAKCPAHAGIPTSKAFHAAIRAEDLALARTRKALAQAFPTYKKLDEDGQPIDDIDDKKIKVSFDANRKIAVASTVLKASELTTAKALAIDPATVVAEALTIIGTQ